MLSRFLKRMAREGHSRHIGPSYKHDATKSVAFLPTVPRLDFDSATSNISSVNGGVKREIHTQQPSQLADNIPVSPSSALSENDIPNWRITNPRKMYPNQPADLTTKSQPNSLPGEADADALHFRR